jgi:TrmH family RNA methyltransferase
MARRPLILKTLAELEGVEPLASIEDERVDRWRRLGLYQAYRQEQGLFQVEGVRQVELLIDAGVYRPEALVVVSEEIAHRQVEMQRRISELLRRASREGVPIYDVPRPLFRRIADVKKIRGLMAIARMGSWTPSGLVGELAARRGLGLVAVAVTDPGNLGTLVRSAHAFGGTALLALEGTTDPFHPKTIRSSAGHLLPAATGSWPEVRDACEQHEVELIGLEIGGDETISLEAFEPDRTRPALVCVGSEGGGFPPGVSGFHRRVSIPMHPGTDSLNAAVAGSLVLWKLRRR